MAKIEDLAWGAICGGVIGAITVAVASTKVGREVLKAAARPAPRKTVVVKRQRTFWTLFDDPDIIVVR